MKIPQHQRDNHERTEELLWQLHALIVAVDELMDNPTGPDMAHITHILIAIAKAKLAEIDHAHLMEWAGLGGKSARLTEAEIALATGKPVPEVEGTF